MAYAELTRNGTQPMECISLGPHSRRDRLIGRMDDGSIRFGHNWDSPAGFDSAIWDSTGAWSFSRTMSLTGGSDLQMGGGASGQIKFGANIDIQANTTDSGFSIGSTVGLNTFSILRRDIFASPNGIGQMIFEAINAGGGSYQGARVVGVQTSNVAGAEAGHLRFGTKASAGLLIDVWEMAETGALQAFGASPIGSAAAVNIGRVNFPATGIFWPADNQMAIGTNGSQRMLFLDTGPIMIDAAATSAAAAAGDIVLSNNRYLRGCNIAGSTTLSLIGADTTADRVFIDASGLGVKFGLAPVGFGVGAAATLGVVGAPGPAAAAQNGWKKEWDNAGNPYWVPIWR